MKKVPSTLPLVVLVLFLSLFVMSLMGQDNKRRILSYSDFIKRVLPNDGSSSPIYRVILTNGDDIAKIEDKNGEIYYARIPASLLGANQDLADRLVNHDIEVDVKAQSNEGFWINIISNFIIPVGLFAFFIFMLRNAGGGGPMSFGKSRAKMMTKDINVSFDDVAGISESKRELEEIVDFLKSTDKYKALGAKVPKGVLLVGPPGCGKTLLAKAVAGEAGVPFFSISGSDFVEMFVGVGASRVRDLFEQAKKNAPCIIFIDEIDAVGRQRSGMSGGGNDEREQTLNQLLVEMDGFQPNSGIIVLAATNRPDVLDKALLRPGRFDRKVVIDTPDLAGRKQILDVHARGKPMAADIDLKVIAKRTPGFSGADLMNLVNESAILAARDTAKEIQVKHIEEAIDKVAIGPEKRSKIIKPKDQLNTAIHEIGHTIISIFKESNNEFHKVTIIPRGMALGLTWSTEEEYKVSASEKHLKTEMMVLLGGRVAEEITFGKENITTGASNDMERCTAIARAMITRYGMNSNLGIVTYGDNESNPYLSQSSYMQNYSDEFAKKIDEEVKDLIQTMYTEVKTLLNEKKTLLLGLSQELLRRETLDKEQVFLTIEQIQKGEYEILSLDEMEKIATSRMPERVETMIREEEAQRRDERERLRKEENEEKREDTRDKDEEA
jgi:cell division protease FtsH